MNDRLLISLLALFLTACGSDAAPTMDDLVEEYLFLELSMGLHDPAHVDAYFGPEEFRDAAAAAKPSLDEIRSRAQFLASRLEGVDADTGRVAGLLARLRALDARIDLAQGITGSFDDEAERLFGLSAPDHDAAFFDAILNEIEALLPGDGDLSTRVNEFRRQFEIPPARLPDVLAAATEECRRRTLEYIELPDNESYTVEYVTDKPWSGYNWYQGNAQSLIQFNTDLRTRIERAVDLGCH